MHVSKRKDLREEEGALQGLQIHELADLGWDRARNAVPVKDAGNERDYKEVAGKGGKGKVH